MTDTLQEDSIDQYLNTTEVATNSLRVARSEIPRSPERKLVREAFVNLVETLQQDVQRTQQLNHRYKADIKRHKSTIASLRTENHTLRLRAKAAEFQLQNSAIADDHARAATTTDLEALQTKIDHLEAVASAHKQKYSKQAALMLQLRKALANEKRESLSRENELRIEIQQLRLARQSIQRQQVERETAHQEVQPSFDGLKSVTLAADELSTQKQFTRSGINDVDALHRRLSTLEGAFAGQTSTSQVQHHNHNGDEHQKNATATKVTGNRERTDFRLELSDARAEVLQLNLQVQQMKQQVHQEQLQLKQTEQQHNIHMDHQKQLHLQEVHQHNQANAHLQQQNLQLQSEANRLRNKIDSLRQKLRIAQARGDRYKKGVKQRMVRGMVPLLESTVCSLVALSVHLGGMES